jgi:ethanolaminephosphotransferase
MSKGKAEIALGSKYFSLQSLENMSKFQYKTTNKSILYKYVTSPALDVLVSYYPPWLAPNLLTVCSFFVNLFTFFVILFESGNDYTVPLSRLSCLLQAITHLLYIILDNTDGKQARKTGTSSSLGLLLDHGCDALTTCIIAVNLAHILQLGNGLLNYLFFFATTSGFWFCTYEEYVVGFLNLGIINGADEGNFLVFLIALISGILGPAIWQIDIFSELKIVHILIILLVIGSSYQILSTIYNIFMEKGIKSIYNLMVDSWLMTLILVLPVLNYFVLREEYQKYTTIILYITSVMFCRVTIQLQCDIVGKQEFNNKYIFVPICYTVCVILLLGSELCHCLNTFIIYSIFVIVLLVLFATFSHFIYDAIETMTEFLGIKFLTITGYEQTPTNSSNTI